MRNRPNAADNTTTTGRQAIENSYVKWLETMKDEDRVFLENLRTTTGRATAFVTTKESPGHTAEEKAKATSTKAFAVATLEMMRDQVKSREAALTKAIKDIEGAATPQQINDRVSEETKLAKEYLNGEKARSLQVHGDLNKWGQPLTAAEKAALEMSKGMPISER